MLVLTSMPRAATQHTPHTDTSHRFLFSEWLSLSLLHALFVTSQWAHVPQSPFQTLRVLQTRHRLHCQQQTLLAWLLLLPSLQRFMDQLAQPLLKPATVYYKKQYIRASYLENVRELRLAEKQATDEKDTRKVDGVKTKLWTNWHTFNDAPVTVTQKSVGVDVSAPWLAVTPSGSAAQTTHGRVCLCSSLQAQQGTWMATGARDDTRRRQ